MAECIGHIFGPSWAVGTDMLRCERCGLSYEDRQAELSEEQPMMRSAAPSGNDELVEKVARAIHAEMLAMEREDHCEGCEWDELTDEQLEMVNRLARAASKALSLSGGIG